MQRICSTDAECFGCGACAFSCPFGAIAMKRDGEGFSYPAIDGELCADCGKCISVCPALRPPVRLQGQSFYALRCRDEELLWKSTSGGAFSLIASKILQKGGLVCGAVYDDSFHVVHVLSGEIGKMRKAKYVQSKTEGCFESIRDALLIGTPVLFSGTPCQCHAVKNLFPEAESLHLLSVACRGVMSPELWEEYCYFLERKGKLSDFCFRDKRERNDAHTVSYKVGGREHVSGFTDNPLCRIYACEMSLRPSCYHCPYTCAENGFDFTVGDFWGVEKAFPDLADGRGVSLVITCGAFAEKLIGELREEADIRIADCDTVQQPALTKPAKESLLRRFLFRDLRRKGPDGHCDMEMILQKYGYLGC